MAYPTVAQFNPKIVDQQLGCQNPLDTVATQKHPLGTRVRAQDYGSLGYGEIELIYLKGVASTAAGDLVVFDPVAATTTRTVAASRGPLAVALSANVASQFGWYVIRGQAPVNTTAAGTGAANPELNVTATAGQATVGSAALTLIYGATCKAAQDTPSSGFTQVALANPFVGGATPSAVG
jgi:hypothetical protein